ncbi:MAG: recombination mediator RecR [Pseudomonadota bacterium]|nr:recombination mediator RecR [Alphaproteobacteria bacterium]MDP5370532.1 recombination mediator RecR [Pseudomonadota bacterium]
MNGPELTHVISLISRLPGLGPRSGRRLVLYLLKKRQEILRPLLHALLEMDQKVKTCSQCFSLDTQTPCSLCTDDRRDVTSLCVVADVADVWALERAQTYKGLYHVLGGLLSAIDGVMPHQLTLDPLIRRVKDGGIDEVVLALNATVEGQTTLHYIADLLSPYGVKVSTLAHGVPVGGELDYLDDGTLHTAFKARRVLDAA